MPKLVMAWIMKRLDGAQLLYQPSKRFEGALKHMDVRLIHIHTMTAVPASCFFHASAY